MAQPLDHKREHDKHEPQDRPQFAYHQVRHHAERMTSWEMLEQLSVRGALAG